MDKKALVRKYRGAVSFLCGVHNAPSRLAVRSRGKGNRVIAPCALLKHVKIRFNGSGNTVIVGDFSRLDHVELYISGNDNVVEIGPWCTLVKTVFCTEDGGNKITIGQGCRLLGAAELAAIESTQITIGRPLFRGNSFPDGRFPLSAGRNRKADQPFPGYCGGRPCLDRHGGDAFKGSPGWPGLRGRFRRYRYGAPPRE